MKTVKTMGGCLLFLIPVLAGIPLVGAALIFLIHDARLRGYVIYGTVALMMAACLGLTGAWILDGGTPWLLYTHTEIIDHLRLIFRHKGLNICMVWRNSQMKDKLDPRVPIFDFRKVIQQWMDPFTAENNRIDIGKIYSTHKTAIKRVPCIDETFLESMEQPFGIVGRNIRASRNEQDH